MLARSAAHRTKRRTWLWIFPALFLLIFFFIPLGKILLTMFTRSGTVNFHLVWQPLGFTIWQALLSTLLTLLIGLPAAFVFSRFQFPFKRLLQLVTVLPFILPTVVAAAGFNALLGSHGILNTLLMQIFQLDTPPISLMNTLGIILLAHVFYNTSIVIRVVGAAISQFDPKIEQAARVLGASRRVVIKEITLPLLRPSILVAALMVFLFDFTSFGVILLLGGPRFSTLEVSIYTQTLSMLNLPMAGLLSIIQLACTFVIMLIYGRLSGSESTPLIPRLNSESSKKPSTFLEKFFIVLMIGLLLILLVSPLLALLIRSFTRMDPTGVSVGHFTFEYYQKLFINERNSFFYVPPVKAAANSLLFAFLTAFFSVILGAIAAHALVKMTSIRKWLDVMIMLPLGTSAVTLGLGFLITFDRPPLDVKSFPLLIPIAHTLVALPFVVRTIQPVLASIPRSLRDAASVLGASPWKVWWQVEVPIIRRAALVGCIFSFTISLGEFGATTFLTRPETPTLPIAIFRFLSQPGAANYGQAMSMASILMLVCALSIGILDLLQKNTQSEI